MRSAKNLEIEALRGVAILMVLYAHVGGFLFFGRDDLYEASRSYLQPGTGVDLFFCVSGYVITRRLVADQGGFCARAIPFWIRRFWRLAPSAWFWLGINLLLVFAAAQSGSRLPNIRDTLAAILQVYNFHFYECANHINATICGQDFVYWSLSLEEQFYLVFPFLIFLLPRRTLILTLTGIVLAQIFIPRSVAGFLWLVRTDAIALGALIALAQESSVYRYVAPTMLGKLWLRCVFLFSIIVLLSTVDAPKVHFVEFATGLAAVLSAGLVGAASFSEAFAFRDGALRDVLVWVGTRSYALYLAHHPIAWLVGDLGRLVLHRAPTNGEIGLVALGALFVAADLNYRFVETPLRRKGAAIAQSVRARFEMPKLSVVASD